MPILLVEGLSPPSQESNASLTCLPIVCCCLSLGISEEWQSLQRLWLIHSPKAEVCVEKEDVHSAQYFRWWCLLVKHVCFRSRILYLASITAPHLQTFTSGPPFFSHWESLYRFKSNSITAPWLTFPSPPTPTPYSQVKSNISFFFTFQKTLKFILFLLQHIHHLI